MRPQYVDTIVGSLFYFFILIQVGIGLTSTPPDPSFTLIKGLLEAPSRSFPDLGAEFEPFQKWLPKRGVISLLMDRPAEEEDEEAARTYRNAQNFLCPLVVTQKPNRPLAIVYCKDRQTAERRLQETGYRWVTVLSDGVGIAAKT